MLGVRFLLRYVFGATIVIKKSRTLAQPDRIIRAIAHDFKEPLRSTRWFIEKIKTSNAASEINLRELRRFDSAIAKTQESFQGFYNDYKANPEEGVFSERISNDLSPLIEECRARWSEIALLVRRLDITFGSLHSSEMEDIFRRMLRRFDGLSRYLETAGDPSFTRLGLHNEFDKVYRDLAGLRDEIGFDSTRIIKKGGVVDNFDQTLISLALQNLISNSIKYRRAQRKLQLIFELGLVHNDSLRFDGPEKLLKKRPTGEFLVGAVYQDNGRGFGKEFEEKVFRPFFQVQEKKRKKRSGSGAGIGLAVVGAAVEKHGGVVWALSEPKQGTKFCMLFPRRVLSGKPTRLAEETDIFTRKRLIE